MQIYKNWLSFENIRFVEKDFGLVFRFQGATFILWDNARDKQFLKLSMPDVWNADGEEYKALKAINEVNRKFKLLKAVVNKDSVWLETEMFLDSMPVIED